MRKIIFNLLILSGGLLFSFVLFLSSTYAAPGDLVWKVTSNPSMNWEEASEIAVDSTGVYAVGYDAVPVFSTQWRMEKRSLVDGNLIWLRTSDPTGSGDMAESVVIDSSGVYIVGFEEATTYRLRIEKRSLIDGSLIWNKSGSDSPLGYFKAAIDSTGIYIVGSNRDTGDTRWLIEKRSLSDGNLIWTQTPNQINPGQDFARDVVVDSTGVYVVGFHESGSIQWPMEKRSLVDGGLIWSEIGSTLPGILDDAFGMTIDNTGFYITGYDTFGACYRWRIEKRSLADASLIWRTTNPIRCPEDINIAFDIVSNSSNIYVVGYEGTPFSSQGWRIEERSATDGSLNWVKLDTSPSNNGKASSVALGLSSIYIAGTDDLTGDLQWRIEKRVINSIPTASFIVTPSLGDTSTTFNVDASGSSDPEDALANLEVRWDWENDGTWDTGYSTIKTASHTYSTAGVKTIKVEVKDTDGSTNSTTTTVTVDSLLSVTDPGVSGRITSTDGFISCGNGASSCSRVYDSGTSVTLNTVPADGYINGNWGGDCGTGSNAISCGLTMNANKSVSATFNLAGDFSLSSSSSSLRAGQTSGSSDPQSTITVNPVSGFNSDVNLSVRRCLDAADTVCSQTPVATGGITPALSFSSLSQAQYSNGSIFYFDTSSAAPGTYYYRVRGTSGGLDHDTSVISLEVVSLTISGFSADDPSSGVAPLNDVDLITIIGGSATGTINYKFDCANDGWDYEFNNISDNPKTVVDACDYSTAGTYTAKVMVERDVANPAEQTVPVQVIPSYTLTIQSSSNGKFEDLANGINCDLAGIDGTPNADCVKSFASGATINLVATPLAGSVNGPWAGACAGTAVDDPCVITMDDDKTVSKTFITPTLRITPDSTTLRINQTFQFRAWYDPDGDSIGEYKVTRCTAAGDNPDYPGDSSKNCATATVWTSADTNIASASQGLVTGQNRGATTVSVWYNNINSGSNAIVKVIKYKWKER